MKERLSFYTRKIYMYALNFFRHRTKKVVRCGHDDYGGWSIITDYLPDNGGVIYSFGIGEDLSFSEAMIKKFHSSVYAFDPTPKSIVFVKNSEVYSDAHFSFYEYGLSYKSGMEKFHLPNNDEYVSGSVVNYQGVKDSVINVNMKSLDDIINELGHSYIDILKMDIEGSEFDVIENLKSLECGQVCIEVHDRFFGAGLVKLMKLIRKMKKMKYRIVCISDNQEDILFVSRDLLKRKI